MMVDKDDTFRLDLAHRSVPRYVNCKCLQVATASSNHALE
jgi:hypothetical protein